MRSGQKKRALRGDFFDPRNALTFNKIFIISACFTPFTKYSASSAPPPRSAVIVSSYTILHNCYIYIYGGVKILMLCFYPSKTNYPIFVSNALSKVSLQNKTLQTYLYQQQIYFKLLSSKNY